MPRPTKQDRERRRLEATAYHEAGHADAAIWFDRRFQYVTINPEADSLGHVLYEAFDRRFRPDRQVTPKGEIIINAVILTALAGFAAEKKFTGRGNWSGAKADRDGAIALASYVHSDPVVIGKYIDFMQARADSLMRVPPVWFQVEAIAAALLAASSLSLTFDQVQGVIRDALQERSSPGRS